MESIPQGMDEAEEDGDDNGDGEVAVRAEDAHHKEDEEAQFGSATDFFSGVGVVDVHSDDEQAEGAKGDGEDERVEGVQRGRDCSEGGNEYGSAEPGEADEFFFLAFFFPLEADEGAQES